MLIFEKTEYHTAIDLWFERGLPLWLEKLEKVPLYFWLEKLENNVIIQAVLAGKPGKKNL